MREMKKKVGKQHVFGVRVGHETNTHTHSNTTDKYQNQNAWWLANVQINKMDIYHLNL